MLITGQASYLKRVSLKELNRATDGFGRIITCDSQTITYQARFQDGSVSVVKEVRSFDEGNHCFNKELQLLGRLHHRHVVALRGYFVGRRRSHPIPNSCVRFLSLRTSTSFNQCLA